jgi:DinB family protein
MDPHEIDQIKGRFANAEQRLAAHAAGPVSTNLTDPDPETPEERWQAGQVWGHLAEFMPYWLGQLDKVISQYSGQPVPFGRTKADAARLQGIADGLGVPIADQMASVREAIAMARNYLAQLTPEQWAAIGLHARRGEMGVPDIVRTFMLDHLEEHASQLDALV